MNTKNIIRADCGIYVTTKQKQRNSNLELYRIIVMLLIIAHHYVVLSGLTSEDGPLHSDPLSGNSIYLYLFGMWGKVGINCFMLITGYFMCTSNISVRKFIKLYLWILTYKILLSLIFYVVGTETLSFNTLLLVLPFTNIHSDSFTSAFMAWWLFIPFLNVLVNNISRKQHILLIGLTLLVFSIYPFVPKIINIDNNPICWFSTLYFIASYIRKYPESIFNVSSAWFWRLITIGLTLIAMLSVVTILYINSQFNTSLFQYIMVTDSDSPLALIISVASFLWFKNIKMRYSKIINILGGASFGILLIHSGSRAMMNWLWKDAIDCVGHYSLPLWQLMLYSTCCILVIYVVCSAIDYTRLKLLEEPFLRWYDKKYMNNKIK